MANGQRIVPRDMSDSHLANTIALIERRYDYWRAAVEHEGWSTLAMLQGEMAQECCERGIMALETLEIGDVVPIYDDLIEERWRRQDPAYQNRRAREVFPPLAPEKKRRRTLKQCAAEWLRVKRSPFGC